MRAGRTRARTYVYSLDEATDRVVATSDSHREKATVPFSVGAFDPGRCSYHIAHGEPHGLAAGQ